MKRYIYTLLILLAAVVPAVAQTATDGTLYVKSLFKYPEAPEYLDDLTARSDYLMDNFWNDMNFKQKSVDQAALLHAFKVYAAPMIYAQKAKVFNSIDNLMKKVSKNPALATQFMKAAEETFHSPRAEVYVDDVYERFLQGYINNKKVKKDRKAKYIRQLAAMQNTKPGMPAPQLAVTDTAGNAVTMPRGSEYTIILFGTPASDNLRRSILQLDTNIPMARICREGNLAINYVNTDAATPEGVEYMTQVPDFVTGVFAPDARDTFDVRSNPSVFLLDAAGNIILGNITLSQAFNIIAGQKFGSATDGQQ